MRILMTTLRTRMSRRQPDRQGAGVSGGGGVERTSSPLRTMRASKPYRVWPPAPSLAQAADSGVPVAPSLHARRQRMHVSPYDRAWLALTAHPHICAFPATGHFSVFCAAPSQGPSTQKALSARDSAPEFSNSMSGFAGKQAAVSAWDQAPGFAAPHQALQEA